MRGLCGSHCCPNIEEPAKKQETVSTADGRPRHRRSPPRGVKSASFLRMQHSLERRLGSQHSPDWPIGCYRVPCVAAERKLKCGGAGVETVKSGRSSQRITRAAVPVSGRRLVSSIRTAIFWPAMRGTNHRHQRGHLPQQRIDVRSEQHLPR